MGCGLMYSIMALRLASECWGEGCIPQMLPPLHSALQPCTGPREELLRGHGFLTSQEEPSIISCEEGAPSGTPAVGGRGVESGQASSERARNAHGEAGLAAERIRQVAPVPPCLPHIHGSCNLCLAPIAHQEHPSSGE